MRKYYVWCLRLGEPSVYNRYDTLGDLIEALFEQAPTLDVDSIRWRKCGFEATGFEEHNYVSCYLATPHECDLIRDLNDGEKRMVVSRLRARQKFFKKNGAALIDPAIKSFDIVKEKAKATQRYRRELRIAKFEKNCRCVRYGRRWTKAWRVPGTPENGHHAMLLHRLHSRVYDYILERTKQLALPGVLDTE